MRELTKCVSVERSIIKKYRTKLWNPFIAAIKQYNLISEDDRIAVCISGGKDSMLLAKLMQQLQKISDVKFELVYLVMDPGYNGKNREKIESNAKMLNVPITVFESDIFDVSASVEKSPCYLCARMRRGHLYSKAKELGCNKIALGHHLNDVIETTLLSMMYSGQLQAMQPRIKSTNFEGMELIRPLYCVYEEDIISWKEYNGLTFLQCACRFTENDESSKNKEALSKRREVKEIIQNLKKINPDIEHNIYKSIHNVVLDTFPGYKTNGEVHSLLENFEGSKGIFS